MSFVKDVLTRKIARSKEIAERRPVFLHSGWRTGSTYIWSKFREKSSNICFYEPLHEMLGTLNIDDVSNITYDSWPSGHSHLDLPYFFEYSPLIQDKGVVGYIEKFAYENFFALSHDHMQMQYIKSLITFGIQLNRRPVFGFCRSTGRINWMVTEFPNAEHVLILRDPLQQWQSMYRQMVDFDNDYFALMPVMIFGLSYSQHPLLTFIKTSYGIEIPFERTFHGKLDYCRQWLKRNNLGRLYELFLYLYVITYIRSIDKVDLSVEIDLLSRSIPYRTQISKKLRHISGQKLDFSDAKITSYYRREIELDVVKHSAVVFNTLEEFKYMEGFDLFDINHRQFNRYLSNIRQKITKDYERIDYKLF